jgi:hypothetical protein
MNGQTISQPASAVQISNVASGSKKVILGVIITAGLAVLAGGGYLILNSANSAAKVQEQVTTAQPLFLEYSRTIGKMAEHIVESSGADSDSMERYALEGRIFVQDAETQKAALESQVDAMSASDLSEYKNILNEYLQKADYLLAMERENVAMTEYYIEPIRKYEKLTVGISGASNYLYSDPDKYVSIVNTAIVDEKAIIAELKKFDSGELLIEYHNAGLARMEEEVRFLERLVQSVTNRDVDAISSSMQGFMQSIQNSAKELSRLSDELDRKVENTEDDLDTLKEKIESEYVNLRATYKF